jgi:hypothetical protein
MVIAIDFGVKRYRTFEKSQGMLICMYRELRERTKHLETLENIENRIDLKDIKYNKGTFNDLMCRLGGYLRSSVVNSDDWRGFLNFTISYLVNKLIAKLSLQGLIKNRFTVYVWRI